MRILYINQYFTTPAGSSGTRAYEFSRYMIERGNKVSVLTGVTARSDLKASRWIEKRQIDGIDVTILNIGYSNTMSYPTRMVAFAAFMVAATVAAVTGGRPDVVFASSTPLTVGVPGMLAAWLYRAPFVFEVRDLWPKYAVAYGALKNKWLIRGAELLERLCYARADRIVTVCETIAADIAAAGGPAEKLVCIPIGADIGPAPPPRASRAGPFKVVYTGAHSLVNALDHVLDAAAVLHARGADVVFDFVGDGRDKPALEARVAREGLTNVRFHAAVSKEAIPAILHGADVGIISAKDVPEAQAIFPNKFFDYASAGLPVIVNFRGELATLLEREDVGQVVPHGDATALADAIAGLAASPERCQRQGQRIRALAVERFDRRQLAGRLERLFQDVVDARSKVDARAIGRAG